MVCSPATLLVLHDGGHQNLSVPIVEYFAQAQCRIKLVSNNDQCLADVTTLRPDLVLFIIAEPNDPAFILLNEKSIVRSHSKVLLLLGSAKVKSIDNLPSLLLSSASPAAIAQKVQQLLSPLPAEGATLVNQQVNMPSKPKGRFKSVNPQTTDQVEDIPLSDTPFGRRKTDSIFFGGKESQTDNIVRERRKNQLGAMFSPPEHVQQQITEPRIIQPNASNQISIGGISFRISEDGAITLQSGDQPGVTLNLGANGSPQVAMPQNGNSISSHTHGLTNLSQAPVLPQAGTTPLRSDANHGIKRGPLRTSLDQIPAHEKLDFLEVIANKGVRIKPLFNPRISISYSYPEVEHFFMVNGEIAFQLLDGLADEGFLDRQLINRIHVCPTCSHHNLNFRETCPKCNSIDIQLEPLIHHFPCAYVGAVSDFQDGIHLICPKCDKTLRHIGLDYEKPADSMKCNQCAFLFTETSVQVQCLHCDWLGNTQEVRNRKIYDYATTRKAMTAVEMGNLQGLDLQSMLREDQTFLLRKEYLEYEVKKEFHRSRRYKSDFSMVICSIDGLVEAMRSTTKERSIDFARSLFATLGQTLRVMDSLCAMGKGRIAVLLPCTNLLGAQRVGERLREVIDSFPALSPELAVGLTAVAVTLTEACGSPEEFLDLGRAGLEQAMQTAPGGFLVMDMDQ